MREAFLASSQSRFPVQTGPMGENHPVSGRTSPLKHLLLAVPLKNVLQALRAISVLFKLQIRLRNEIGCVVAVFKRNDYKHKL